MTTETATFPQTVRADADKRPPRAITVNTPLAGMAWFGGWVFTIGYAHLTFWQAVVALCIWPYFLGVMAR